MRDERIWTVYLLPHGNVAVFDLYGEQMPQYQDPAARARLDVAFPRHLWHEWVLPGLCRCGFRLGEHARHDDDEPPLKRCAPRAYSLPAARRASAARSAADGFLPAPLPL